MRETSSQSLNYNIDTTSTDIIKQKPPQPYRPYADWYSHPEQDEYYRPYGETTYKTFWQWDPVKGLSQFRTPAETTLYEKNMDGYIADKELQPLGYGDAFKRNIRNHELQHQIFSDAGSTASAIEQEFYAELGAIRSGDEKENELSGFQALDEWGPVVPELLWKRQLGLPVTTDSPYVIPALLGLAAAEQTFGEGNGVSFVLNYQFSPQKNMTVYNNLIASYAAQKGVSGEQAKKELTANYVAASNEFAEQLSKLPQA